jgi:putative FmdB family regulatory protein
VPIYDYVCSNGHVTEVIHGIYDAGPNACPVCGAPLRKAMSAPAIVFKGSGWAKKERTTKPSPTKSDGDSTKTATASTDKADNSGSTSTEASKPASNAASEAS